MLQVGQLREARAPLGWRREKIGVLVLQLFANRKPRRALTAYASTLLKLQGGPEFNSSMKTRRVALALAGVRRQF